MCELVFCFVVLDQGLKHADRMWPTRVFCATRNAYWEFSNK